MKFFKKRASIENYKEFKKVFSSIKTLSKQNTMQELDMAAGFMLGITAEKRISRKISEEQKTALEEMIESVWKERRQELEYADELEEQLAEDIEEFFIDQL